MSEEIINPEEISEPSEISESSKKPCCKGDCPRGKLHAYNWLADISDTDDCEYIQVQFKNTRNGFYLNASNLDLKIGDMVAVEASPGHDIGQVTMVGRLVKLQMKRANIKQTQDIKKVFRKARPGDLEKYEEARAREHETMIRSRKISEELGLNMKIGDVEYQGDGAKAIFYYIADERVDFRKLIRILADTFKIRVEMKQIGARQEAGRIGGIGPCGRPLCCSTWMSRFISVGTSAARFQDLSMNPQKLAGQCAKLKCCLNFEVDTYMESNKKLPPKDAVLQTQDSDYFWFKADILTRMVTYSTDKSVPANLITIPARRAFEIIALNKQGVKVEALSAEPKKEQPKKEFVELVGQDDLTRFDSAKKKKKKKKPQGQGNNQLNNQGQQKPQDQGGNQGQPKPQNQGGNQGQPKPQNQGGNQPRKNRKPRPQGSKPHGDKKQADKPAPDKL